jgi:hypothetical protein
MSREAVNGVLTVLLQLGTHSEWEARHGGLLGLKYLLAVREVMVTLLLLATSEIPVENSVGKLNSSHLEYF